MQAEVNTVKDMYLTLGVTGLVIVVFIALVIYYAMKLKPTLDRIQLNSEINMKVLENCTKAVQEVSRSNDNVASALTLVRSSVDNSSSAIKGLTDLMIRHDERAQDIDNRLVKTYEAVRISKEMEED